MAKTLITGAKYWKNDKTATDFWYKCTNLDQKLAMKIQLKILSISFTGTNMIQLFNYRSDKGPETVKVSIVKKHLLYRVYIYSVIK